MASSSTTVPLGAELAIKVAGALSGSVFLPSLDSTVGELRAEVARLLGGPDAAAAAATVKLIVGGKTLNQDAQTLRAVGITPTSRVLVTRGAAAGAALASESDRMARLERVKRVVEGLVGRDGRGRDEEGYELALENQAGGSVKYRPEDQKALVMGLTMHERGKASMAKGGYAAALDELMLSEECFSLVEPSLLSGIDNVGMLLLDVVWCAYKLGDVRRLAVCRERLGRAREALTRAYGPNLERARRLHGTSLSPELGTFVRLEAMEGVVAYHSGDPVAAEAALRAAEQKLARLKVDDGALAQLGSMGYKLRESRRALRFAANDVAAATSFLAERAAAAEARAARRRRADQWRTQRSRYGRTPSGAWVEVEPLDALCGMGYELPLAAEALRQSDNNANVALEALLDPGKRAALGLAAALQAAAVEAEKVEKARKEQERQQRRQGEGEGGGTDADAAAVAAAAAAADGAGEQSEAVALARAIAASWSQSQAAGEAAAGAAGASTSDGAGAGPRGSGSGGNYGRGSGGLKEEEAGREAEVKRSASDAELEDEILSDVKRGQDPMDAYDIEVEEEEEVVRTFLALLASQQAQQAQV